MEDRGMPVWKVIFSVSKPEPDVIWEEVRAWTPWKAVQVAYRAKLCDPDIHSLMVRHVSRVEVLGGHASIKNPMLSRIDTQEEVDKELREKGMG